MNSALCVVFVRVRIAEIYHRAVTMVPRDKAVEAGNGLSNAASVAGDDGAEVFGIEPRGERRRSDQVCRRSIGRESHAVDIAAAGSARNLVPQSPQNLFGAGFAAPQAAQCRAAVAPHRPQNFPCSGTSAAQFVQCIRTSTDI
jgi:hypothetical protein